MAARSKTKPRTSTKPRKSASRSTARRPTAAKRAAAGRKGGQAKAGARTGVRGGLRTVSAAIAKAAKEMGKLVSAQVIPADAISLLKQDHREVEAFFAQFEEASGKAEKGKIAAKICLALTVHATIEEEVLYPPAHEEIEADLVDEAIVEHNSAKQLIAEIEAMSPGDDLYDAKVKVLSEYIKHHVKEEEKEMFPQLKASGIDLRELGRELMERKVELLMELTSKG